MAAQEHQKHPPSYSQRRTYAHTHTRFSALAYVCYMHLYMCMHIHARTHTHGGFRTLPYFCYMHLSMCTCTRTHTSTHPSPFERARLAGGDLPLLGGFPGCLINYPSPIVYQEAEVETRGERRLKMATVRWRDPFPCQCGGGGYGEKGSKRESRAVKRA